eukprot:jgi/Mesvir1/10248/Mv08568-RA.1
MAPAAVAIVSILVSIALMFALIYTNIRNDPKFAAKMPKFVVDLVTEWSDPRTDDQKKKDAETKEAQEAYSKDVDAAIKKAAGDKVDLVKVWTRAVEHALSVRLTALRSARDKLPHGEERKAANEDVNQFKELSQFLEYVFEREMKEDAFAVLSAMIPIVKAIGASESTVDYIVRSPLEWVKNERRYADNVANYVIHVFAKETEFAVR